jgi:hypothetical protein
MPQIDFDGANSAVKTDKIQGQSGTTVTITSGHSLSGSGASLTNLPASAVSGTHTNFTSTGIDDNAAGATAIVISADEEVTMPLQPFVELKQNSEASNITGDGTTYAIAWDSETFDVGSNYASNTFTAPVTGHYLVAASIYLGGITAAADTIQYNVTFTNRSYCSWTENVNDLDSNRSVLLPVIGQMDAGDTITQSCRVNGESSNVVDFLVSSGGQSWFSVALLN